MILALLALLAQTSAPAPVTTVYLGMDRPALEFCSTSDVGPQECWSAGRSLCWFDHGDAKTVTALEDYPPGGRAPDPTLDIVLGTVPPAGGKTCLALPRIDSASVLYLIR